MKKQFTISYLLWITAIAAFSVLLIVRFQHRPPGNVLLPHVDMEISFSDDLLVQPNVVHANGAATVRIDSCTSSWLVMTLKSRLPVQYDGRLSCIEVSHFLRARNEGGCLVIPDEVPSKDFAASQYDALGITWNRRLSRNSDNHFVIAFDYFVSDENGNVFGIRTSTLDLILERE